MTPGQRLKKFYEDLDLTQESFANSIGASQQYISAVVQDKRQLGKNISKRIESTYPNLNIIWLLHGKGTMYNEKFLDGVSDQVKLNGLLLNEIAGIKAHIKGTLFSDELNELQRMIDKLYIS